jgi:hypothetical protein
MADQCKREIVVENKSAENDGFDGASRVIRPFCQSSTIANPSLRRVRSWKNGRVMTAEKAAL